MLDLQNTVYRWVQTAYLLHKPLVLSARRWTNEHTLEHAHRNLRNGRTISLKKLCRILRELLLLFSLLLLSSLSLCFSSLHCLLAPIQKGPAAQGRMLRTVLAVAISILGPRRTD